MSFGRIINRFKALLVAVVFVCGMSASAYVAYAANPPGYSTWCDFSIYGRNACNGYLSNTNFYNSNSTPVYEDDILVDPSNPSANAIPASVNSTATFEAFYENYLSDGSPAHYDYDSFGAAITVDSMLGASGPDVCLWYTFNVSSTCSWQAGVAYAQDPAHLADWVSRVNYYESNGWINWNFSMFEPLGYPDSGHACTAVTNNWSQCSQSNIPTPPAHDARDVQWDGNNMPEMISGIAFNNPDGSQYILDRFCSNEVGMSNGIAAPNYTLTPVIVSSVNGTASNFAQPGDTIKFQYSVTNAGADSGSTDCTSNDNVFSGYHQTPGSNPYDTTDGTPTTAANLCTNQDFPGNATTAVGTYTVPASQVNLNTTICSSVFVTPGSVNGGVTGPPSATEACVMIGGMPYVSVFGGDVSAGNAQHSAACNPLVDDYNAGIVGWNQDNSGVFAGAGTQFADFAVGQVTDFSSAQPGPGVTDSGPAPAGLLFANTTSGGGSDYGGGIGSGALPCMSDYYNVLPGATTLNSNTGTLGTIDVSKLTSGAYVYNGPTTLTLTQSSTIPNGTKVQLYVPNQNVYIKNNITYHTGWSSIADIPMFELVDNEANIYIDNAVTELDGTYIAQNSQADGQGVGGQIATCASSTGPEPLDASLSSNCNNQLIVNGAFIADDIALERSSGTLNDSNSDCPCHLNSSAGEQFNYNPSLWIVQPPSAQQVLDYNAVSDMPPVL